MDLLSGLLFVFVGILPAAAFLGASLHAFAATRRPAFLVLLVAVLLWPVMSSILLSGAPPRDLARSLMDASGALLVAAFIHMLLRERMER
ncbi:MAG: hypothetical protein GEU80_02085 [Dehalococcoidia bacterium]|nr:hypothetical protein [Dehalococcoidia bacterium]